ncbi:radical SAM family heme chaperone HemW [Conexibacter sp. DBS9H8]|uniref:radical SAM family heme chaperone HemW n=1 Tax=Conexibacter sp. DBS9H8 TaxID=2937801 RepID=UPI00200E0790|nr:radical SAM family heme chaperone HemW [Conexibacter sp. DBS9H8]
MDGGDGSQGVPLGLYVHVPFCAARCGYCDFNTYVPADAQAPQSFLTAAHRELELARTRVGARPLTTVFFGGGTPTLLGADALVALLAHAEDLFGLDPDAEVTTEANPESIGPDGLRRLRAGGFTRLSVGMQSTSARVLSTLSRVHTAGRALEVAREARAAGFPHVSLDLIYGTPGETDEEWAATLEAALSVAPDHLSAYALTVEAGTALAAEVRRGTVADVDEEIQARRWAVAETRLSAAGMAWYEISSWARRPEDRCRHNLGYWRSHDWWGIGPGAHSHLAGVRWSNVRHPGAYARRCLEGRSPVATQERLSAQQRALEALMLGLRTREGADLGLLDERRRRIAAAEERAGRVRIADGRITLTSTGRLLASTVTLALAP